MKRYWLAITNEETGDVTPYEHCDGTVWSWDAREEAQDKCDWLAEILPIDYSVKVRDSEMEAVS